MASLSEIGPYLLLIINVCSVESSIWYAQSVYYYNTCVTSLKKEILLLKFIQFFYLTETKSDADTIVPFGVSVRRPSIG